MNRREFLGEMPLFGVASILTIWGDSVDYEDSEETLQTLADKIDRVDITDPQMTSHIVREIVDSIDTAKNGLNSRSTARAETRANTKYWIKDALSILPGVSTPDEPPINAKISAIESALAYYTALHNYLRTAEHLHSALKTVDFTILDTDAELPAATDRSDTLARLNTRLSNLTTQTEQTPSDDPQFAPLLPDQDAVQNDVTQLETVYTTYVVMQNSYLEASRLIQEGATQRENQQIQRAYETFNTAASTVAVDIPADVDGALSSSSLSIGEYREILTAYQDGVSKLTEACSGELAASESRNRYGDGLDRLFDAQAVIASA